LYIFHCYKGLQKESGRIGVVAAPTVHKPKQIDQGLCSPGKSLTFLKYLSREIIIVKIIEGRVSQRRYIWKIHKFPTIFNGLSSPQSLLTRLVNAKEVRVYKAFSEF